MTTLETRYTIYTETKVAEGDYLQIKVLDELHTVRVVEIERNFKRLVVAHNNESLRFFDRETITMSVLENDPVITGLWSWDTEEFHAITWRASISHSLTLETVPVQPEPEQEAARPRRTIFSQLAAIVSLVF